MRIHEYKKWLAVLVVVAGIFLLASAPAFACPTCYTAALGAKGIQALKSGILTLLIPTATLFSGLIWVTFRYRNSYPSWQAKGTAEDRDYRDADEPTIEFQAGTTL